MTKEEIIHIYENSQLTSEYFTGDALATVYVAGLAALRAQPDRGQWAGCNMCKAEYGPSDWGDGGAHDFRIRGDTLYYFDPMFGWEGIKIKFCPICGRHLTEDAWAEQERRFTGTNEN